jgi:hypothetical protein
MKRLLPIAAAILFASSAFAGLTYKVQSATTGFRSVTMVGTVVVDGPRMRMNISNGDKLLFKDNSIVFSTDGGKTMTVIDPSTKSYYEVQLDQLVSGAGSLLKGNPMIKISFENPKVSVRDGGNGGTIEGYPTHKSTLDASYDIVIDAMGTQMTSHMQMTTESWTTDQLPLEFSSFLQAKNMRTGVEALDTLIEAQSALKGFPLKQVSSVQTSQNGRDMTMTTTATVTNIAKKDIAAAQFTVPDGYTKIDDPLSKMVKGLQSK